MAKELRILAETLLRDFVPLKMDIVIINNLRRPILVFSLDKGGVRFLCTH
jgi:hypothetical protein